MKLHKFLALLLTLAMVLSMAVPVLQVAATEEAATEATEEAATEATETTEEVTEATTATEPEETVSEETTPSSNATVAMTTVYDFSNESQLADFSLYQSASNAFTVVDGVLKPNGTDGEQKAMINNAPEGFDTVSVDILPGESGNIYAGFYFGASNVDHAQDAINSQVFLIKSDYTGWTDAPNRIDIVQGQFNNGWTHISTNISESGNSNNLFSGGTKQPLTLKLTFGGNVVLVTLSLKNNSSKYVQYMYEYEDAAALQGQIGLRTIGSDTCFDNLTFYHRGPMPEDTLIWDFESPNQDQDFTFHQSGTSYLDIAGGKMFASGNTGIFEAVLSQQIKNIKSISVNMYPGGSKHFFGGIFLGSTVSDGNAIIVGARRDSDAKKPWNEITFNEVTNYGYTEKSAPYHSTWFSGGHKAMNLLLEFGADKIKVTTTDLADPTKVYSYEFAFNANNFDGYIGLIGHNSNLSFDDLTITYDDTYYWDFNNVIQAEDFTVGTGTGSASFNGTRLYTSGTADGGNLVTLNRNWKNIKSISFDMISTSSARNWGGISLFNDTTTFNFYTGGRRTSSANRDDCDIVMTGASEKRYTDFFTTTSSNTRNNVHVVLEFADGKVVTTVSLLDASVERSMTQTAAFDMDSFSGQIGFWINNSNVYYDNLTIVYEPEVQMPSGSIIQEDVDTTLTPTWDFNDAAQAEDFIIEDGTGSATFTGATLYANGTANYGRYVMLNKNLKNIKSISFDIISGNSARNWGGITLYNGVSHFIFSTGGRRTSSANRDDCDIVMTGATEKRYSNFFTTGSSNTRNNLHVVLTFADGYDNFTVTMALSEDVPEESEPEESVPDESEPEETEPVPTDLVDFETATHSDKFDFYHSSNGGLQVVDGKLAPQGEAGEFKAIYKDTNAKFNFVSVEIYPGANGFKGGIYIDVTDVDHPVDRINAFAVFAEGNHAGWEDAPNRTDLVIAGFPVWTEYHRLISETGAGNALFTGGVRQPVKMTVAIHGNQIQVKISLLSDPERCISATYAFAGVEELGLGNVGIYSGFSDCSFDNFAVGYETVDEDKEPDVIEPAKPQWEPTDLVDFETDDLSGKFDFYHSAQDTLTVQDGKLVSTGALSELKAIYRDGGNKVQGVSVDIYPGQSGQINAGIYIGASTVEDGVDRIKGLSIMVESNHSGWDDAINRIDLVVGRFPIWKELHRYTSETGNGNALFAGAKEPVNLQVDINGNEVTVTLSLLSDPDRFVTTVYQYSGAMDLAAHNVGLRSAFNDVGFDDFAVYTLEGGGSADPDPDADQDDNTAGGNTGSGGTTPDTGDTFHPELMLVIMVLSLGMLAFLCFKKRSCYR